MKNVLLVGMLLTAKAQGSDGKCTDLSYVEVQGRDTLSGSYVTTYNVKDCDTVTITQLESPHYGYEKVLKDPKAAILKSEVLRKTDGKWNCSTRDPETKDCVNKSRWIWNVDRTELSFEKESYSVSDLLGRTERKLSARYKYRLEGDEIIERSFVTSYHKGEHTRNEWLKSYEERIDNFDKLELFR